MLYGPKRTFDRRIAGRIGNRTDSKTGRWNTNSIVRITIAETAEVIGKVRNQPNGSRANL